METPSSNDFESTSRKSNNTHINELLMPTIPDLNELTCRRITRERESTERFDPSATTTVKGNKDPSSYTISVLFSMICLVINGSMPMSSQYSST